MSSETAGAEWSIMDRTLELLAVHCGTVAYQEDGDWVCAVCDEPTRARDIPGWLERAAQMRTGTTTRG
jgi:hypothetical protein